VYRQEGGGSLSITALEEEGSGSQMKKGKADGNASGKLLWGGVVNRRRGPTLKRGVKEGGM